MAEAHPHLLFANKYSEQHKSQMGANVSSTAALTETNQLKGDPNPAKSETVLVDDVITLPEIRHWTRWSDVKLATYLQPNHKWETTDKYRSQVKLLLDQNFDLVRLTRLARILTFYLFDHRRLGAAR